MFLGRRDEKACQLEIDTVEDYASRVFGTEVDLLSFREQVHEIIVDRISDYIYQRYRDWAVADLITLEAEIEKLTLKRANVQVKKSKAEPISNKKTDTFPVDKK